jgi:hypothetical protein
MAGRVQALEAAARVCCLPDSQGGIYYAYSASDESLSAIPPSPAAFSENRAARRFAGERPAPASGKFYV